MRIAFLFDPKMVRLPFDVARLWEDPRGLTGSEVTFFRLAAEMGKRGHCVEAFTKFAPGSTGNLAWRGLHCWRYEEWPTRPHQEEFDAAVSYISGDPLRSLPTTTFRIVHQQCRGWSMSSPGWEAHVDLVGALSSVHARDLLPDTMLPRGAFRLMPNGVDLEEFRPGVKVPGRVVWASSPERGLHRLLEAWPLIKRGAPHATLHVFYDMHCLDNTPDPENRRRAAYIKAALPRMERAGVRVFGSASRARIAAEMAAAEVLAYPLETTALVETFGVTVLEAMAAGVAPVLCFADAFEELWGESAAGVSPPIHENIQKFALIVVAMLTDGDARADVLRRTRRRAEDFAWDAIARDLERTIETRGEQGFEHPKW